MIFSVYTANARGEILNVYGDVVGYVCEPQAEETDGVGEQRDSTQPTGCEDTSLSTLRSDSLTDRAALDHSVRPSRATAETENDSDPDGPDMGSFASDAAICPDVPSDEIKSSNDDVNFCVPERSRLFEYLQICAHLIGGKQRSLSELVALTGLPTSKVSAWLDEMYDRVAISNGVGYWQDFKSYERGLSWVLVSERETAETYKQEQTPQADTRACFVEQAVVPGFPIPVAPESTPEPAPERLPFNSIPQSMREVRRWSVWQKQADGQKIPYAVLEDGFWSRSKRCKSNDPSMWVSFDEALHCFLKSNGHLGGLSFALGDDWAGVDFDDVIVGGQVHIVVKSWLASLGGYQEVSQSKEGIKTILRGTLSDAFLGTAETGRMFKGIPAPGMATEVWYKRRFFFLTGEGSGEPRENQAGLNVFCDELLARWSVMIAKPKQTARRGANSPVSRSISLSDDEVLDRIRNSRQVAKFEPLWNGQIGSYPSASEADLALTKMLMWWCQNDKAQVERLFERSGLAKREKWNRDDYRERTLAKAECSEVYVPSKADAAMARIRNRSKGESPSG